MRKSTNYGLKLMEGTDNVKRQDFVDNFEIIDREMKNNDTQVKEIANKVDNIKIADGTTTTKGIVKLNNATNSTSQTEAATPSAVKSAMDRANAAFQSASDGKNAIAGKVGNVTGSNTHTEVANRIQVDKNTAATNLSNKGISASGNEALASLVSKIANIELKSKEVYGTISIPERVDISSATTYKVSIGFKARIINIRFNYETLSVYSPNINYSNNGYYVRPIENGFEIYSQSNGLILDKGKELRYHVIGE